MPATMDQQRKTLSVGRNFKVVREQSLISLTRGGERASAAGVVYPTGLSQGAVRLPTQIEGAPKLLGIGPANQYRES